jgi:hypothetical protein
VLEDIAASLRKCGNDGNRFETLFEIMLVHDSDAANSLHAIPAGNCASLPDVEAVHKIPQKGIEAWYSAANNELDRMSTRIPEGRTKSTDQLNCSHRKSGTGTTQF